MHERAGVDGQKYAIHFHMRLPTQWNKDFFFQGGGGTNGTVGDALGHVVNSESVALGQGFAVVSQDSGHDNATNADPSKGGLVAFGFDPQARADYGHTSLPAVAAAAKALIGVYYGKIPHRSYFVGCSKGGQEGMAFAQQYPEQFDGIIAESPGMSLPRAALAEVRNVQTFGAVVETVGQHGFPFMLLPSAFSDADLALVREAALAACDAYDGLRDGIIGAFAECSSAKVMPELTNRKCSSGKADGCLSSQQIDALDQFVQGPRDSHGNALYSDWPWDGGIGSGAWRPWILGVVGKMPALNILIGGLALAEMFSTPPTTLAPDPQHAVDFEVAFNFDRDSARIYATSPEFPHAAWDEISARSVNLDAFRAHGGKLIVPHGVSDPVFSINDTISWYRDVNARIDGKADTFIRVFPVPGMAHCGGGPATDNFDTFTALRMWVERGQAPERIVARAGALTPWPGRSRPLCAYPKVARYNGNGDPEKANSFACRK